MNDNPEIHSRRVARLKLVLPGLAIFVLGLLVIFSRSGNDIIQLNLELTGDVFKGVADEFKT